MFITEMKAEIKVLTKPLGPVVDVIGYVSPDDVSYNYSDCPA